MKPIDRTPRAAGARGPLARLSGLATLLLYAVWVTVAHASTVLVDDTTLVTGSQSVLFSFEAPGPGTVSVQLTNLDWPQALSSLSFLASTSGQVLWSSASSGSTAQSFAFQVGAGGRYFADVTAVAGGSLDLGAYSFLLSFTPASVPVPLPAGGALLLTGVAGLIGLMRLRHRVRAPSPLPPAAYSAP